MSKSYGCSAPESKLSTLPLTPVSDTRDSPTAALLGHSAFNDSAKDFPDEGLSAVGKYHTSSCPICLESFALDNPAVAVGCGHTYHLQCIEDWRQRSPICPVCMIVLRGDGAPVSGPKGSPRPSRRKVRLLAAAEAGVGGGRVVAVAKSSAAGSPATAAAEGNGSVVDVGEVTLCWRLRRWFMFCCGCEDD